VIRNAVHSLSHVRTPMHLHIRPCFRLILSALFLMLLGACSTVVQVPSRTGAESAGAGTAASRAAGLEDAKAGYARVLQRHVNSRGEVDFAGLRDDTGEAGLRALEAYVNAIALTPLDAAPTPNARLVHMVNAYNALSMYNVIASGIPASHDGFAKVKFFVLRKFVIGGATMSLYDFENNIIRKLDDPRVHFALNCSAVSCPVLPRAAFAEGSLNEDFDRETRNFFARPENLSVDDARRTVSFNEILKFYTEDFVPGHAPTLIAYAQRYVGVKIPADYNVVFRPYDWTIANSRRPRPAVTP
jgi:hypothetical protein